MEFFDQFSNKAASPEFDQDIFEPVEGFTGEHVEPISVLVHRLTLGQFVSELPDGVYVDEQPFDSEYLDNFEAMDRSVSLQESLQTAPERPQSGPPLKEKEGVGAVPDSELAAPGEP